MEAQLLLGGTVRYEDGIKTTAGDQFSPTRKVAVELNFAIPEDPGVDADSYVNDVLDQAISLTNQKLGIKTATKAAKAITVGAAEMDAANKAQVVMLKEALAEKLAEKAPAKRGPGKPKAPAAEVVDEIPLDGAVATLPPSATTAQTPTTAAASADAASMEEWGSEPVTEVTDKDLNDAVQKRNAVLKDPQKIKGLIGAFNADPKKPFTLREIPQIQRQTFLQRLEGLA